MKILQGLLQPSPKKALYMVSTGESTERRGIGCAVKFKKNYYVLTCRDVASPEDAGADHEHKFILDRFCSRFPKHTDRHRQKIQDVRYDNKFSVLRLPNRKVLSSYFPLDVEDEGNEKVYSYYLCNDGKGVEPIDWSHDSVSGKYSIGRDDLDSKDFLGSPVLYSDGRRGKTFVVGVVGKEGNGFYPMFLERASPFNPGVPNQVEIGECPSEILEGSMILTWIAPKENGAVITEYIVYQREVNENGSDSDWERKPTGQVVLQHEVIGLKSRKMYEFQVTAKNWCGESAREEDKTIRVKVFGVPNQVKIVEYPSEITEDRVTLRWRAPEDNGTVITAYTVYQRELTEDGSVTDWERKSTGPGHQLHQEVSGLESEKTYQFQVTATNQYGERSRVEDGPYTVQIACVSAPSLLDISWIFEYWWNGTNGICYSMQ